jgi:3-methyladenine DNA glycosylase AlkD
MLRAGTECATGSWLEARERLASLADAERAAHLQRFFRTEEGGYGEGDLFLGLRVPVLRQVAKEFRGLSLEQSIRLLESEIHEERLLALFLLVDRYERGDEVERQRVFDAYLAKRDRVNNWDLVDASAPYIFGRHLFGDEETERLALAASPRIWDRRIAMVSTLHSIRQGETAITWRIAEMLLNDSHDLIHKAVGWMLREAGKKELEKLHTFLNQHAASMPRTMLRYAIERLPEEERRDYMSRRGRPEAAA